MWTTSSNDAEIIGIESPAGRMKIEYSGPSGRYTSEELSQVARDYEEYGWAIKITQMNPMTLEYDTTTFNGAHSIRQGNDYFALSFRQGVIRMSVNFDLL